MFLLDPVLVAPQARLLCPSAQVVVAPTVVTCALWLVVHQAAPALAEMSQLLLVTPHGKEGAHR